MANFPVFKLHHKKAGAAASAGNAEQALHHVGKMLSALRATGAVAHEQPMSQMGDQEAEAGVQPPPHGLRARLAQMKTPLANSSGGM